MRRRPEPQITYAIWLIDRHLKNTSSLDATRRIRFIADLFIEAGVDGFRSTGGEGLLAIYDKTRKRIERATSFDEGDYRIALVFSGTKNNPKNPPPSPFITGAPMYYMDFLKMLTELSE